MSDAMKPQSRTKIGRAIFSEAFKNLNKDKSILWLPIIGFGINLVVAVIVFAAMLIPSIMASSGSYDYITIAASVLVAIVAALVHVFTQASVMSAANQRYQGQTPTIGTAVAGARAHFATLFKFGLLEATVGMILRAIKDNFKMVGGLISIVGGLAWGVATYFAIPAILFENAGPIEAIKKSGSLITSRWGAALRVNVLASALFVMVLLLGFGGFIGGIFVTAQSSFSTTDAMFLGGLWLMGVSVLFLILVAFVQATVMSYACVALYRYAVGQPLPDFNSDLARNAFRIKGQRFAS